MEETGHQRHTPVEKLGTRYMKTTHNKVNLELLEQLTENNTANYWARRVLKQCMLGSPCHK
eukprot:3033166-Amphidinium_carterae.1